MTSKKIIIAIATYITGFVMGSALAWSIPVRREVVTHKVEPYFVESSDKTSDNDFAKTECDKENGNLVIEMPDGEWSHASVVCFIGDRKSEGKFNWTIGRPGEM